ncbi:MAG: hypothetical protein P0S94_05145, partial [Simkaniaceae bacterium]|nr:hypothetical protein [Simkaniaceae bacterium]
PHINKTLDAFDEAIEVAIRNKYTSDEIKQAKIGLIQRFDSPISPGARGITAYNWMHTGRTLERRQKYRDAILSTNAKSVSESVEKHLANFRGEGTLAVLAGKELIEKEKLNIETETI